MSASRCAKCHPDLADKSPKHPYLKANSSRKIAFGTKIPEKSKDPPVQSHPSPVAQNEKTLVSDKNEVKAKSTVTTVKPRSGTTQNKVSKLDPSQSTVKSSPKKYAVQISAEIVKKSAIPAQKVSSVGVSRSIATPTSKEKAPSAPKLTPRTRPKVSSKPQTVEKLQKAEESIAPSAVNSSAISILPNAIPLAVASVYHFSATNTQLGPTSVQKVDLPNTSVPSSSAYLVILNNSDTVKSTSTSSSGSNISTTTKKTISVPKVASRQRLSDISSSAKSDEEQTAETSDQSKSPSSNTTLKSKVDARASTTVVKEKPDTKTGNHVKSPIAKHSAKVAEKSKIESKNGNLPTTRKSLPAWNGSSKLDSAVKPIPRRIQQDPEITRSKSTAKTSVQTPPAVLKRDVNALPRRDSKFSTPNSTPTSSPIHSPKRKSQTSSSLAMNNDIIRKDVPQKIEKIPDERNAVVLKKPAMVTYRQQRIPPIVILLLIRKFLLIRIAAEKKEKVKKEGFLGWIRRTAKEIF